MATDLVDLIHESVVTRDADGRILSWNAASESLYGHAAADAVGQRLHDLLASRHESSIEAIEALALADGAWEGELVRSSANGQELVLEARWIVERDGAGGVVRIIETARDISRRKASEEKLRLSEFRYRNMFQAMAVAFWEVDFTAVGAMLIPLREQGLSDLKAYLLANRNLVRETMERAPVIDLNGSGGAMFGAADPKEIIGQPISRFWPRESEPVYVDALVATMTRQPHLMAETQLRRLDGSLLDVLFTVSLSQENRRRGVMLIGVIDITARKTAETALARVQAEFAHAARVSMLGELTASIAHEVNQPLTAIAISGAASLRWLHAAQPDLDEVRSLAQRIVADARRAADIIARVRAMAEPREPERAMLDLAELVAETLSFLDHELRRHGVAVELRLGQDPLPVLADRTQIQQVLVNLAMNAIQAMAKAPAGRLHLSAVIDQGHVALTIEDEGTGLGAAPDRLFDSFYTTKKGGMGMGLPICRSILDAHGGSIEAENGERGARFTIRLPSG